MDTEGLVTTVGALIGCGALAGALVWLYQKGKKLWNAIGDLFKAVQDAKKDDKLTDAEAKQIADKAVVAFMEGKAVYDAVLKLREEVLKLVRRP